MKINSRHLLIGLATLFFVFIISFSLWVKRGDALSLMSGFGGRIAWVMPCPCSLNLAILIAPTNPLAPPSTYGIFSFEPGSVPFAWYQIFRPGPAVKGTYVAPKNECLWPFPDGCEGFDTRGTIVDVGTSL